MFQGGGKFLTTFFSGYTDEHDLVTTGGYPGKLRDILGIWVEEENALPEEACNRFSYKNITYPATLICDLLYTEAAQSLSEYEQDFYAGMPALTCNHFDEGTAYYVATRSNADFYRMLAGEIFKEAGIKPIIDTLDCIKVTKRSNANGTFLFFLNHDAKCHDIKLNCGGRNIINDVAYHDGDTLTLPAKDVAIILTEEG